VHPSRIATVPDILDVEGAFLIRNGNSVDLGRTSWLFGEELATANPRQNQNQKPAHPEQTHVWKWVVKGILAILLGTPSVFSEPWKLPPGKEKEVGFPLPYYSPITGTFAEIRNHNLHLGSDFKSYGLNGHSVLATFDGYVEELSYSETGYGLSFHIYSPDLRLKSKYAHLFSYQGQVSELEYLRRAFLFLGEKSGFQIKLPPNAYPVKRGMPLAKTGE